MIDFTFMACRSTLEVIPRPGLDVADVARKMVEVAEGGFGLTTVFAVVNGTRLEIPAGGVRSVGELVAYYHGACVAVAHKLTDDERDVMNTLATAWIKYSRMPVQHADEQLEFRMAIHRAQDIVSARLARRCDPIFGSIIHAD